MAPLDMDVVFPNSTSLSGPEVFQSRANDEDNDEKKKGEEDDHNGL